MKRYGKDTPAYDYLGLSELNPVKAVEVMELLNFKRGPTVFAKGALEAAQLDVSRLFKGRLLNAAEFNLVCMRGCVEEIRNEKKNKDFVRWVTDPLLLVDPIEQQLKPSLAERCVIS